MRGMTLCSGGGLVEAALPEIDWVAAVEWVPEIAAHHKVAHPQVEMIVGDVCDVDYKRFRGVHYLHASPPCQKASEANVNPVSIKGEQDKDLRVAEGICNALEGILPHFFTLENVAGYRTFAAFALILKTLHNLKYEVTFDVYDAFDYGASQRRKRLYLRAVRTSGLQPLVRQPGGGWLSAIEDLIPTLLVAKIAQWQFDWLRATDAKCILPDNPLYNGPPLLIHGIPDNFKRTMTAWPAYLPARVVIAGQAARGIKAWFPGNIVKKISVRCLTRWQGISDKYPLPVSQVLAGKIVGNGVQGDLQRAVVASLFKGTSQ